MKLLSKHKRVPSFRVSHTREQITNHVLDLRLFQCLLAPISTRVGSLWPCYKLASILTCFSITPKHPLLRQPAFYTTTKASIGHQHTQPLVTLPSRNRKIHTSSYDSQQLNDLASTHLASRSSLREVFPCGVLTANMRLPCASTLGLRIVQCLLVLIQLQTISSAAANDRHYFSPQFFNEFYDSAGITNRGPSLQLLPRAEPSSNASTVVLKDKPSAPDGKLDWDDAVSKGKNLIKLLATKHLSTCGVEESNFTDEKQLFGNGWNEVFKGEPKDNTGWSLATKKLKLPEDVRDNIQYDAEQSSNVTVDAKSYQSSEGLYSNVMNTHGTIYALYNFSPRTRGASLHPPVDGSPGGEFVPLQSWADIAFIEWADACKGNEKCIKCHAMSNATDRIATKALGDKHDWKTWPGKTFQNGSEELAAILATPSGRGVAWLLLTHRKGLGWKYVDSVDVWSEKEHDSEQNFFTFHIKDRNENQESKSNEERSTPATVKRGGLIARADLWEDTVEKGKRYLSMLKCGSGTPSEFTSYQSLADWGWEASFDTAPFDDMRKEVKDAIKAVGADSTDMATWREIVNEHTYQTVHDGETYPATDGYYDNKYSAEFIIATMNWSPKYVQRELQHKEDFKSPKLARLSDVVFLEFQRYMASIKKPLTGLKGMLRDNVINPESQTIAMKALGLGRSDPEMLPNWPGRKFDADSGELAALVACPNGRGKDEDYLSLQISMTLIVQLHLYGC